MMTELMQSDFPVRPHRTRWLPRIALLFASLLAAVVLADIAARLLTLGPPVYEPRRYEPDNRVPFAQIPSGPITYQPGVQFASVYDRTVAPPHAAGRVEYAINSFGFRGPETSMEKKPGTIRIACLGDSFTFGEGVSENETWPRQLEALLNQSPGKKYEAINGGVQGHGTIDEFLYYKLQISRFAPDIVILSFVLNDAMDGAETIRRNDEWTKTWEVSALSRVSRIAEIVERSQIAAKLQDDNFAAIRASFDSPRWELCKRALGDLKRMTSQSGARLVVVIWPIFWRLDADYPFADLHEKVAAACKAESIECVDLLKCFSGQADSKFWVHPTDHHPNATAQSVAAQQLGTLLTTP